MPPICLCVWVATAVLGSGIELCRSTQSPTRRRKVQLSPTALIFVLVLA